jgi:P4 family phage/plasmid primase-like protien
MDYLQAFGANLIERGYPICAIQPRSKRPIGKDWQNHPLTTTTIKSFPADAGIGILCGVGAHPLCCLDLDAADEAVVRKMEERIGGNIFSYAREGRSPRRAYLCLANEAGWRKRSSARFAKGDTVIQLETLGAGQQFVAYGIHEKTQRPYQWVNECPWDTGYLEPTVCDPEYLPKVTQEDVTRCLDVFAEVARECGYQEVVDADNADAIALMRPTKGKLSMTLDEARDLLAETDFSKELRRDPRGTWLYIGMALHFEFDGSEAAALLWDEWSKDKEGYRGWDSLHYIWRSFKRDGGENTRTMRWIRGLHASQVVTALGSDEAPGDAGLVQRVLTAFGVNWKYCPSADHWYHFDGVHWRPVIGTRFPPYVTEYLLSDIYDEYLSLGGKPELLIGLKKARAGSKEEAAQTKAERIGALYNSVRATLCRSLNSVLTLLAKVSRTYVTEDGAFDPPANILGVANGDVDLVTGEFLAPSRRRMVTRASSVEYDAEAKCPLWRKTVAECLGGKDVARFFQKLVGYIATGSNRESIFPILYGNGCNGKSTIINTLAAVFGEYAKAMQPETLASFKSGSGSAGAARADLIDLIGARFVFAQESAQGARLDTATVKALTGKDAVKARRLYGREMEEIHPQWTILLSTNYKPEILEMDYGTWRRIIAIHFPRNFDKDPDCVRDKDLDRKLLLELPGILNWVIEGAVAYYAEGLTPPASVEADTKRYHKESDFVAQWVEDCCTVNPKGKFPVAAAYASWTRWSKDNAPKNVYYGKRQFGNALAALSLAERGRGTDNMAVFVGIEERETDIADLAGDDAE